MNWTKIDADWWRGDKGAYIRRVFFTGKEICKCEKCNGKLIGIIGERFCGWIDGGPVSDYYRNFGDIKKILEENLNEKTKTD